MAEVGVKLGAEFAAAIPTAGASIVFNPEINAQGGLFYSDEEGLMGDFEAALNTLEFASPPFAAIFGPLMLILNPCGGSGKLLERVCQARLSLISTLYIT